MAFLELDGVSKSFGATTAVARCDLAIEHGAFVSFLGPSGCGKTTTLRMIAGFEAPTAGAIRLDGEDITRRPANRRKMGVVFQSYALFPNMTVGQNIGFGLTLEKQPRATIARRVGELLDLVDLPGLERRYPHQLSGGQQQRVALARALAAEPRVLLLDEPLSALDAKIRVTIRNEIRAIQRQVGITTIYVTHDQEEALALSDQIAVMNKGRIEQVGTPFQIYNHPQTAFVASFVGTVNLLHATVQDPVTGIVIVNGQPLTGVGAVRDKRPGDSVTLALRPEVIALAEPGGVADGLRGIVDDVTFLGTVVRVLTRVGSDTLTFDLLNHPDLVVPQRGQPVALTVAGRSCLLLEDVTALQETSVVAG
jgi:putative spermidine/putrescine transport system ATP-binding protein